MIEKRSYSVQRWFPGVWLLIFSIGLLMVCSGSSWLHPYHIHLDTSWFFMAGKAWMNGMTPYVDFSDSKGPLLWLIYGLGYLISPHSYSGVFIFEVISYWATFYLLYRIAKLFLESAPQALLASMLMGLLFFYPGLHQETRIEDFSHFFNAAALYILLRSLYFKSYKPIYAVYLGILCGCMLMMKYSYFLTLLVPSGMIFLYQVFNRGHWCDFLIRFFIGIIIIATPFIVYFLFFADLGAFINEYFLNTGSTILKIWGGFEDMNEPTTTLRHPWPVNIGYLFLRDHYLSYFMTVIAVGVICGIYFLRNSKWTAWTVLLWYGLSVLLFSVMSIKHLNYYMNLCIFGYSLPLGLVFLLKRLKMKEAVMGGALTVGCLAIIVTHYIYSEHAYAYRDKLGYDSVGEVVDIINARERQLGRKPTLVFYHEYEKGEHVRTNALPGIKYWSIQAGMTDEMYRQLDKDLFSVKPDFVVINENFKTECHKMEEAGYKLIKVYTPLYPIPGFAPPNSCLYMYDHPK